MLIKIKLKNYEKFDFLVFFFKYLGENLKFNSFLFFKEKGIKMVFCYKGRV